MQVAWRPHPGPQTQFCATGVYEALYGGAAGGGKSDCLLADALRYVHNGNYSAVLFRRTFPQLEELIDRSKTLYPKAVSGADWRAGEHRWHFPNGAKIKMSHMQHEDNKYDHQGKEYQYVGFDELTQFTETQYKYLFSRVRSTDPTIRPKVRATTNPGGIGHKWVKERFKIGVAEPGEPIIEEIINPHTGEIIKTSRVFIPGKLEDNPTLLNNDPLYVQRLLQLPELERMRLMDGIWDAFEGQAFSELSEDLHGFDFDVPPEWPVYGSFDWGYAKPYHYGLWAVDYDGRIYMFAEVYGCKEDTNDTGVRQSDGEIARHILELEDTYGVRPKQRIADPACWSKKPERGSVTGPSVATTFTELGCHLVKAHNARVPGRQQLHHRLKPDEDGKPWIYFHKRCASVWDTIPELREDEKNPEDIVTKDVPDHCYDSIRYMCMSHQMRPKVQPKKDTGSFQAARARMIKAKRTAARYGISVEQAYGR